MGTVLKLAIVSGFLLTLPEDAFPQVSYGLEGGLFITNLNGSNGQQQAAQYSFGYSLPVGVFLEWQPGVNWSINSCLTYLPLTIYSEDKHPFLQQTTPGSLYTDCTSELRLHYLSLPVRFQYSVPVGKEFSLFGQAGAGFQLLILARKNDEGWGTVYGPDKNTAISYRLFNMHQNVTGDYQTWNIGLEASVGCKWQVGGEFAVIKLGTLKGTRPIERDPQNGSHTTGSYFLTIGYGVALAH